MGGRRPSKRFPMMMPLLVVAGSSLILFMVRSDSATTNRERKIFIFLPADKSCGSIRLLWHPIHKSARRSIRSAMWRRSCCAMRLPSALSTASAETTRRGCARRLPPSWSKHWFRRVCSVSRRKKNEQATPRQRNANARSQSVSARWPDGTPRSSNNAFTGDFPRPEPGPTRTQVLNGLEPKKRGTIPWDGPYTVREGQTR